MRFSEKYNKKNKVILQSKKKENDLTHTSSLVEAELKQEEEKELNPFFLLTYSSELNMIERKLY